MNSPRAETLDLELSQTINKICSDCQKINDKDLKIRILQWLDKVRRPIHNFIWKQNSLLYARVFLEMILEQQLDKPFIEAPSDWPLARLDKFDVPEQVCQKLKQVQQPQSPRKSFEMILNQNLTLKLKIEPPVYKCNKFHHSQNSQKSNQIKEIWEGANKNMQEFKNFLAKFINLKTISLNYQCYLLFYKSF